MTRFEQAIGHHATRLHQQAGESVSYQQGSTTITGITAVPDNVAYTVLDGDGTTTQVQVTDWLIKVSDLTVEPRAGDRITRVIGATTYKYDVLPIDDDRPCCEWHDNAHVMLLVHSKRVQ